MAIKNTKADTLAKLRKDFEAHKLFIREVCHGLQQQITSNDSQVKEHGKVIRDTRIYIKNAKQEEQQCGCEHIWRTTATRDRWNNHLNCTAECNVCGHKEEAQFSVRGLRWVRAMWFFLRLPKKGW